MHIDLTDKIILVTGGSRGIGAAVVRQLGQAGATVAVHFNRAKEAAEKLALEIRNNSAVFQADLGEEIQCIRMFSGVLDRYGKLDVLINNAGIALHSPVSAPAEKWVDEWERTMRVNLTATALLCKLAINQFTKGGGGRIINIASRAAFRGDTVDYMAYAASKGGMVALTRSIARGFGKDHIKAFVIAPGFVRTEMAQDFFNEYGEEPVLNEISLPVLTEPGDVAPLVTFLASGLADHATGGTFDLNAGSYVH